MGRVLQFNKENKRKAKRNHATRKDLERKLKRSQAINRGLVSNTFITLAIIGLVGFIVGGLVASK